jgi:hypothetical protein
VYGVRKGCACRNYTRASASFEAAQAPFEERIRICPKREFLVLSDALDWASDELERARAELDAHIREHCCMVQGSTVTQD